VREPIGLRQLQEQFARAMSAPIDIDADSGDYELRIDLYPPPLVANMAPRSPKSGIERLSVHNQQYWFRLLTVMQEEYPLLCKVLGLVEFNRMVVAYLTAHPSRSPLLRHLSDPLCAWIVEDGRWNRPQVLGCARLEHLYIVAFDARVLPEIDASTSDPSVILSSALHLQPHLGLFHERFDLVDCRQRVHVDDQVEVRIEPIEGWWAIFRSGGLHAERLNRTQHRLLTLLSEGQSLIGACETVQHELDSEQLVVLAENIQAWFARWMSLGWFCEGEG
jgi:hypothetical protein